MEIPRRASISATSCGVETIKAPGRINKFREPGYRKGNKKVISEGRRACINLIVANFGIWLFVHHQCQAAYPQQEYQDLPNQLPLSFSQEHSLPVSIHQSITHRWKIWDVSFIGNLRESMVVI